MSLAAASLAHTVFFVSFTFGMGLVSAVAPLAAQAFGARDPRMVRAPLRVGLWAALLISLPLMALPLLRRADPAGARPGADDRAVSRSNICSAWPGASCRRCGSIAIRGFMSAVNRPEPILWITLAAIPANALLVYPLLYGAWGLPQLGLFGAGLATSIVNLGTFLAGSVVHLLSPAVPEVSRARTHLADRLAVDAAAHRRRRADLARRSCWNMACSAPPALLMGLIGTTALAAHQIALQIAAILFMVPFGIGMAATVRVGHAVGRDDPAAVNRAGFVATAAWHRLHVGDDAGRDHRADLRLREVFFGEAAASAARLELTATLLLVGATFFIADGIQTVAAGALRGMNDTRVPLLFATISYWLIGFACAGRARVSGPRSARSASGSGCRAAQRLMRSCSSCASACSRAD